MQIACLSVSMPFWGRSFNSQHLANGLAIVLLGQGCSENPAERAAKETLLPVVEEIMSVAEFSRSPEPNHGVTKLAYIRQTDRGNALWELDLVVGGTRLLPRKEQARRLFDWSPDDRFLLLRDFDSDATLALYDTADGSFRPAMQVTPGSI